MADVANAIPPVPPYATDNIRLAAGLHAGGHSFATHRHPSASGNGQQLCFFTFEASPAVLLAAHEFYRGELKMDPSRYEQAKREVYAAVNAVLRRSGK